MQQNISPLADLDTWVIDSPLIVLVLFGTAFLTAWVLVRTVPTIGRTVATVEATRHQSIDGLRGCLGIAVFIHHVVITWYVIHGDGWIPPRSRFVDQLGSTSVALFFMITAFLFWGRVLSRGSAIDWPEFLVSRIYRLYPVYLLTFAIIVVLVIVLTWPRRPESAASQIEPVVQWLLMFRAPDLNGLPNTRLLAAGVLWSLRYEWLFYLSLPFLGLVAGRSRQPLPALLSAMAAVLLVYWAALNEPFDKGTLFSFAGGIIAAHWVRRPRLVEIGRSSIVGVTAVAALLVTMVCFPTAFHWEGTILLSVFFVAVASGQSLFGLLRQPALLLLGDITYGVYLLHGLPLWAIFQRLMPREAVAHWPVFLFTAAATAVLVVLLATVVFLTIERPAILMGRRHYRWLSGSMSAVRAHGWRGSRLPRP